MSTCYGSAERLGLSKMSIVEPTPEMVSKELALNNALIATPVSTTAAPPKTKDVHGSISTLFGSLAQPTAVTAFPPDFVLHFETPEQQCFMLEHGQMFAGPGFQMFLRPWNKHYRSQSVIWETKVTIDITGVPPYACFEESVAPMLACYCDMLSCNFNKERGTCRVNAFAASPAAIPAGNHLGVKQRGPKGTRFRVYYVTMQTYLYGEAPKDEDKKQEPNNAGVTCAMPTPFDEMDPKEYERVMCSLHSGEGYAYDRDREDESSVDSDIVEETAKEIYRAEDRAKELGYLPPVDYDGDAYCGYDTDLHGSQG